MESSNEWQGETDITLWRFADELNISRLERFGLPDSTLYRLDVLRRTVDLFGIRAEEIGKFADGGSGCWLHLYGAKFAHRVTVNGDKEPVEIGLLTCELDRPEVWTPRFQGQDTTSCWLYLLQKVADIEGIGFHGTEGIFEVPH